MDSTERNTSMNFDGSIITDNCIKWKFSSDEFTCYDNTSATWCKVNCTNVTIGPGHYKLTQNSSLIVCVPAATITPWMIYIDIFFVIIWLISCLSLLSAMFKMLPCLFQYRETLAMCSHMLSMLINLVSLIAYQLIIDGSEPVFFVLSFLNIFSMYSEFTWMHVVYYYLLTQFNSRKILQYRNKGRSAILAQIAYGWGSCFVCTLTMTILDALGVFSPLVHARGGIYVSFVHQLVVLGVFTMLSAINVILYSLTMWNLKQLGDCVSQVNSQTSQRMHSLYMKLFLLTGILCVPVLVGNFLQPENWIYAFIPDTIAGLHGFFLGIIYGKCFDGQKSKTCGSNQTSPNPKLNTKDSDSSKPISS